MLSRRLQLAIGFLLTGSAVAYVPFADVEEFNPQPLGQFCDPEVKTGIRLCEGKTHRTLEDGGVVSLNWAMHTDPDRILSLDTERKHGVRVVKCTPSSLELVLPESHAGHVQVGELIVGSHFVHGCQHLMNRVDEEKDGDEPMNFNMYHRVVKVVKIDWRNADGSLAAGSAQNKVAHAKVWTKELSSIHNAVGSVSYDFDYTPLEAIAHESAHPKRTTWDSDFNRGKWVEDEVSARRLNLDDHQPETFNAQDFSRPTDSFHGGAKDDPFADVKYRVDDGQPLFGGTMATSNDVKSLMNMQPKKVANFGWNWNFKLNASQDISFNYTVPGNRMYVVITKPYIKAHSKIRFRLRSYMPNENAEDTFFDDNKWVSIKKHMSSDRADVFEQYVPRVKWEAEFSGHGELKAGLLAQMNAAMDISSNPLELIQIPVLQEFWKPKWFGSVDFPLGNLPVTLSPGIQFKAKFFHYGSFRGSLQVGVQAHPVYHPKLQFDSFTGLRVDLNTNLKEVTLTPPNWMVSTSHFECGLALEPTIWIKGHIGETSQDTKFAAALRPFFNMTITREGHVDAPSDDQKELVIYPFRVVDLPVDSTKRYRVRIETSMPEQHCRTNGFLQGSTPTDNEQDNGQLDKYRPPTDTKYSANGNEKPTCEHFLRRMDSTDGLNWGELEFHDPVERFSFGMISQRMLMFMDITAQIIEVDVTTGLEKASEKKWLKCTTIIGGVCQPSPMEHTILWGDSTRVQMSIHMIWKENPRPWFATRIRGVAASFPEVIVNKDYIQQVVPGFSISQYANKGSVSGTNVDKPLVLVLRHAYKSYPIIIDEHNGYVPGINSSSMTSNEILELGASFLSSWDKICLEGTKDCDPKLILYYGDTELAKAEIPAIPWNTRENMQGTYQAVFGNEAASSRIVPVTVALKPVANANGQMPNWHHVGLVRMKFAIANPAAWNRWISPYQFTAVKAGQSFKLVWTLNDAQADKATTFSLVTRKGVATSAVVEQAAQGVTNNQAYLRPRIGSEWFDVVTTEPALTLTPIVDTSGGNERARFEHDISFGNVAPGDTVLVTISWMDAFGNTHTMSAPPFLVEGEAALAEVAANTEVTTPDDTGVTTPVNTEGTVASNILPVVESITVAPVVTPITVAPVTEAGATIPQAPIGRRLDGFDLMGDLKGEMKKVFNQGDQGWKRDDNGEWSHEHYGKEGAQANWDTDRECAQKDLNFAFGAGIMFRAYVEHLSLPVDLPVLGAIQGAPELGIPWQEIVSWQSHPTDLSSKLPSLLCRHGVCSATLPGCPAYSAVKHYYPEFTIAFKKTLEFPNATGSDKDQWIAALKAGLSYTFAMLPEAITIIMHYVNLTAPAGESSTRQFHNVMMGTDACENHAYNQAQCTEVGCCQWDSTTDACDSAVGTGACLAAGVNSVFAAPTGINPAPVVTETPVAGAAVATGLVAGTELDANGVVPTVPTVGDLTLPTVAPDAGVVPTVPPVGDFTLPTVAPGVTVPDVPLGRRLHEDRTHVYGVSVQFKNGLRYKMDDKLVDEMYKQGLFQQAESVKGGGAPLQVHSWAIRDMRPDLSAKYAEMERVQAAGHSPLQAIALAAFAGCVLVGVAFAVRRRRSNYLEVEESYGPVE